MHEIHMQTYVYVHLESYDNLRTCTYILYEFSFRYMDMFRLLSGYVAFTQILDLGFAFILYFCLGMCRRWRCC